MRRLVVTLGLLAAAAGCSLLTSLDGYTSGGAADASVATDASGDAAPTPSDAAAVDAGADADAGARFCAQQSPAPAACEDFDGPKVGVGWTPITAGAGTASVEATGARTPPGSLLTRTTGSSSDDAVYSFSLPDGVQRIRFAYDVRVEALGQYAEIGYVKLATTGGAQFHYVGVTSPPQSPYFVSETHPEDGGHVQQVVGLPGKPDLTKWTRIEVVIDFVAHLSTVSVDGSAPASLPLEADAFVTGTSVAVHVGIEYTAETSEPTAVRFDDVIVDWK